MKAIIKEEDDLGKEDFVWEDEVEDEHIVYIENLVRKEYQFDGSDFTGGDTPIPPFRIPKGKNRL